jgi:hypothetical protein
MTIHFAGLRRAVTGAHVARTFLIDYRRNGVNLLLLILVPVVFVVVAARPMADAARLLGGPGIAVETATAGWAAAFLTGVAMYFQVRASRATDRRLIQAGLRPRTLVSARLATGLALAVLASIAALTALQLRTGISEPGRVVFGTLMFAVIYLGLGAAIGAMSGNPVNGTVIILFIWIIDIFFGPALSAPDRLATRWLPTHFVTLWMVDLPSRHGGAPGDLGWALTWTAAAVVAGALILTKTTGARRTVGGTSRRPGTRTDQYLAGARFGLRDYRRNPVLVVLLIIVPVIFIWLSKAVTPGQSTTMIVPEHGRPTPHTFWLPDVHAGTMTPIAIASLATLTGLFVVLDARTGDPRLALAGFKPAPLLLARMTVIATAVALTTTISLSVTWTVFDAQQWLLFTGANLLLAITYALLGVCIGPIFGRISGVFIAFLIPFIDLGIGQSPMLRDQPPTWAKVMPGYGAYRVLIDAGLTPTFDTLGPLLLSLAWIVTLAVAAARLLHTSTPRAHAHSQA